MADIVPIDEFLSDEWYPGFKPAYDHAPWVVEPVRTFSKRDEERFWFMDFHWPRGLCPMGVVYLEDGHSWGTQWAAEALPLPSGKGIAQRLAGTHVYAAEIPVESEWERLMRTERLARALPNLLQRFPDLWAERVRELETGLRHFETYDFAGRSVEELTQHLRDTRVFHRRAWEVHFEIMYPLLANYIGFRGLCSELGIDPAEIAKFLQGYDTKILETDRKLWRLTDEARDFGLEPLFRTTEPENLSATLAGQGGSAATWLSHFEEFLSGYGWRTEGIADVNLPSWVEDPTSPLGTIKTFLAKGEEHDFAACREAAVEEREAAVDAARSRLTAEEQTAFDQALALCRHANFAWWNEEHDFYIDLRATIPLRQALLAIGETLGCDRRDDTLFLFWPELMRILSGSARHPEFRALIDERRAYFDHWAARRPSMPKVLGTTPDEVRDPILVEIFGLHHQYLSAVRSNDDESSILVGVAASAGMARGRARVLHSALDLHRVAPGEILVCEATSPNWTPAFAKISGCVCDGGGTLTHASIVSREYRVPCVVGVGRATSVIKDGDELEVNGTKGIVTVFRARQ